MPKYYCDYCDTFLTHDSPSVRKTHNGGRKHKENVRMFYQKWMEAEAQKLVDATAKAFAVGRGLGTNMMMQRAPAPYVPPIAPAPAPLIPRPAGFGAPQAAPYMIRPPGLLIPPGPGGPPTGPPGAAPRGPPTGPPMMH